LCSNVEHANLDLVLYEKLLDDFVTIFLKVKADLIWNVIWINLTVSLANLEKYILHYNFTNAITQK